MMAREAALERLGITQEFGFEDHAVIYSYADNNAPINEAPIKIVDTSVESPCPHFLPRVSHFGVFFASGL